MMRVRMLTLSAGPDGILYPGHSYDLGEDQARALVSGGFAVPVRANVETAAVRTSPQPSPNRGGRIEERAGVSIETGGRKTPGKVK